MDLQVVSKRRVVLDGAGCVQVVDRTEFILQETRPREIELNPLKLYLIRKGEDQERPMMPCTNVAFLEDNANHRHGYEEPIRDRDKNWRKALWTSILPALMRRSNGYEPPQSSVRLINEGMETSKVFISGMMMNKTRILRRVRCLGSAPMIITIYGLGINGRVFIVANQRPRYLLVVAYDPSTTATYTLRLDMAALSRLFAPHLLEPGRKRELCRELICRLWLHEATKQLRVGEEEVETEMDKLRRCLREQRLDSQKRLRDRQRKLLADSMGDDSAGGDALRDRFVVLRAGLKSNGVHFILTATSIPRKKNHYRIEAYDPFSSAKASLVLNAKSLAVFVGATDNPKKWTDERLRQAMKQLVPLVILQHDETSTTMQINNRKGLPASRFSPLPPDVVEPPHAELEKLRSQLTGYAEEREIPCSRGCLYSSVTPLRLIGKGPLLCTGSKRMIDGRCLYFGFEEDADLYRVEIFDTVNSCTTVCHCSLEDAVAYLKGENESADTEMLLHNLVHQRVRMRTDTKRSVYLDRRIYCNGARLHDKRKEEHGLYCIVSIEQQDGALKTRIFCPRAAETLTWSFGNEAGAMIALHKDMSLLERRIHLFTYVSNLAIELDPEGKAVVQPLG